MAIDQTDPMIGAQEPATIPSQPSESSGAPHQASDQASPDAAASIGRDRMYLTGTVRRISGAIGIVGRSAAQVVARVPRTMSATRAGAHGTTTALQTLPDPTLRSLAWGSVALGAGFYLAGAPRPVVAAGVVPAMILGAAIALRPTEPLAPVETER